MSFSLSVFWFFLRRESGVTAPTLGELPVNLDQLFQVVFAEIVEVAVVHLQSLRQLVKVDAKVFDVETAEAVLHFVLRKVLSPFLHWESPALTFFQVEPQLLLIAVVRARAQFLNLLLERELLRVLFALDSDQFVLENLRIDAR